MGKNRTKAAKRPELKVKGFLIEKGVRISKKQGMDELTSRGYGVSEDNELSLTFYEALYLLDKKILEVKNEEGRKVSFPELLQAYKEIEEKAWSKYLTYRDLRGRGYVVREGFGLGIDFRVYKRGRYGEETARYLVLSMQEGNPITMENLARVLKQCHRLKKELVVAVMNRRGEIVYYSVSQLTIK